MVILRHGSKPPTLRIPTGWYQVGGDVDAKEHGIIIARMTKGGAEPQIELVEAHPIDESEGRGWYRFDVDIPVSDLDWHGNRDAARSSGLTKREWEAGQGFAAEALRAVARYQHWGAYHLGGTQRTVRRWRDALPIPLSRVRHFQR
jgi:hypothetical protein